MKKKNSILLIVSIIIGIIIFNPIICHAWDVENVSVSNVVIRDGRFNSFDFHFEVPSYLAETQSWLGLQSVKFQNGDFTDAGTIYYRGYAGPNAVMNDDDFRFDYGITNFSKNSFSCFGNYSSINETFSDLAIDEDANATYYVYLWTFYGGSFYPDSLLATVEFNNGTIKIVNSSNTEIVDDTFDNLEAEVVDKIEIDNVNFEIKVGDKPKFTGEIKNNSDRFDLAETFMALTREDKIGSDDPDDKDELIKDFKYYHITKISIKDNVNLKFDENTKVYINGVEQKKENMYISNALISVSNEKNAIIPSGYVAPAYLDEDFAKEQMAAFEKDILEMIKDRQVKFDTDETKETVDEALENNDLIEVELWISESIAKTTWYCHFDEEIYNALNQAIGNNYKIAAYYNVAIIVYVDGHFIGFITEIPNQLSITVPFPNGVPNLSDGYQRVWKLMRYHNGEVIELDAQKTENGMTFDNDKYSYFALLYEDIKIDEPDEEPTETDEPDEEPTETDEPGEEPTETDEPGEEPPAADEPSEELPATDEDGEKTQETDEIDVPQTGDNIINYIFMLVLSFISFIGAGQFVVKQKLK